MATLLEVAWGVTDSSDAVTVLVLLVIGKSFESSPHISFIHNCSGRINVVVIAIHPALQPY